MPKYEPRAPRFLRSLSPALLLACAASTALAQLPSATLTSIYPAGGKAGSEFEAALSGANLDDGQQLLFSHAGITAKPKLTEATEFEKARPVPNQFVVTIAPDVPVGIYEAHFVGRYGISNPRAFAVGDLAEVIETGANNTPDGAMEVPLESTINGRTGGDAIDHYKLALAKGQRVIIDCWSTRLDSKMDGTLAIHDKEDRLLAMSRDRNRRDPFLDFTAPADGEYVLKVYDFIYQGGNDYHYRVAVSTKPYLDFVFPPSGMPGTKSKFTLYGRNLPGGAPAEGVKINGIQLEKLDVEIDVPSEAAGTPLSTGTILEITEAEIDGFEYRLSSPQGVSNPVLISLATAQVVAEQEPNDEVAQAQTVTPPCELVGQSYPRGDMDWVTFEAKKGDLYWVEVFSQRLGLPTDPYLFIQQIQKKEEGEGAEKKIVETVKDITEVDDDKVKLGGPGFDRPTADPAYRFAVPEDGTYRVLMRDLYSGSLGNPRFVYRLSIRPEKPDFRLATEIKADGPNPATGSLVLRKGGTAVLRALAFRRDGFNDDIVVTAEGLPEGVTCVPAVITAGQTNTALVLTAADNAADWAGPIEVVGKAKIGDAEVVRKARGGTIVYATGQNNALVESRVAAAITLAVTGEAAPLAAAPAENKAWATARAGKISIPFKVNWTDGVKGDLKLDPVGLPKEIQGASLTVKNKAGEGAFQITVDPKAKPGNYSFHVTGQTKLAYARNAEAAKEAEAEKEAVAKQVAELTEANKQAAEAKQAAEKVAAEKAAAVKAAAEADAAAAAEAAKAAEEAKAAATNAAAEAAAKLKAAQDAQKIIDKRATDLANAAKPKDIDIFVNSPVISLSIAEAPANLAAAAPAGPLKQGEKIEIDVSVERLFDFADEVAVALEVPKGLKGLSSPGVKLAKDQATGKLAIQAAKDASPGAHKLNVNATLKYNGQNITVGVPVELTVEEVKEPEKK